MLDPANNRSSPVSGNVAALLELGKMPFKQMAHSKPSVGCLLSNASWPPVEPVLSPPGREWLCVGICVVDRLTVAEPEVCPET